MHREGQKQALTSCLKPILAGRKALNAFVYGPCGTGKTMLVNWILDELRAHSSKVRSVYVNCWKHNTTHAMMTQVLNGLGVFTTYRQATHDLFAHLEKELEGKELVLCLDEVDVLEDKNLLYDFSRAGVTLVMISNDPYALVDMDLRIKSSLHPETIEFPHYSTPEIFDILDQRRPYAFVPGAVKEKHLKLVSRLSEGDARVAIETLRRAALLAEDKSEKAMSEEHIKEVFRTTTVKLRKTEALKKLNEHEKVLYLILEEEKKLKTKELFDYYSEKVDSPATQRSYRNYMNKLVRLGLVKAEGELTGRQYSLV